MPNIEHILQRYKYKNAVEKIYIFDSIKGFVYYAFPFYTYNRVITS